MSESGVYYYKKFSVDKTALGRRVLELGHFLSPSRYIMETQSAIRVLLDEGKSEQYVYEKVKPIYEKVRESCFDDDFATLLSKARKLKVTTLNRIVLYQSDVDFINSFDLTRAEKVYALVVLAYLLSISGDTQLKYGAMTAAKITSLNQLIQNYCWVPSDRDAMLQKLVKVGLVCIQSNVKYNKYTGEYYAGDQRLVFADHERSGRVIVDSTLIYDVEEAFNLFDRCCCSVCGQEFVKGNKSKTILCSECYKKKRRETIAENTRKYRSKKRNE